MCVYACTDFHAIALLKKEAMILKENREAHKGKFGGKKGKGGILQLKYNVKTEKNLKIRFLYLMLNMIPLTFHVELL